MSELEREALAPEGQPSEVEGGGAEQTWGQGEGTHEPTIPDDEGKDAEETPSAYSSGTAAQLDDPDLPLARDDEGMDR